MDILQDRLLRTQDVLAIIPWSKMHLWRQVAAGKFPQPLELGPRTPCWRESEVRDWLNNRRRVQYGAEKVSADG